MHPWSSAPCELVAPVDLGKERVPGISFFQRSGPATSLGRPLRFFHRQQPVVGDEEEAVSRSRLDGHDGAFGGGHRPADAGRRRVQPELAGVVEARDRGLRKAAIPVTAEVASDEVDEFGPVGRPRRVEADRAASFATRPQVWVAGLQRSTCGSCQIGSAPPFSVIASSPFAEATIGLTAPSESVSPSSFGVSPGALRCHSSSPAPFRTDGSSLELLVAQKPIPQRGHHPTGRSTFSSYSAFLSLRTGGQSTDVLGSASQTLGPRQRPGRRPAMPSTVSARIRTRSHLRSPPPSRPEPPPPSSRRALRLILEQFHPD